MFTHEVPLSRPRLACACLILAVAVILGTFVVDAHGAGATPSKTPHSCKVAIRDAQKALHLAALTEQALGEAIKLVPSALEAAASGDGDTLQSVSDQIASGTATINGYTAQINGLKDEFQSNRAACLAG